MEIGNVLIGLIIFLIIAPILWLIVRYFFMPFYSPKFDLNEAIKYLEKNNCIYIDNKFLTNKELKKIYLSKKIELLSNIICFHSNYLVICHNMDENKNQVFLMQITHFPSFIFNMRKVDFQLIENEDFCSQILKNYTQNNFVKIGNNCPACGSIIADNDETCRDCGLSLKN